MPLMCRQLWSRHRSCSHVVEAILPVELVAEMNLFTILGESGNENKSRHLILNILLPVENTEVVWTEQCISN